MKNTVAIAASLILLACSIPAIAQTRRLLSTFCRQGTCLESYVVGKRLLQQDQLGGEARKVYSIDVEIVSKGEVRRQAEWVQCSTEEPFVAFEGFAGMNQVVIHYLNPGGEPYGYNSPSHATYWAVCHNMWNVNLGSLELARTARRLGYSSNLRSDQKEVPKSLFQR